MANERRWTHMDKSSWERGPWDDEPDKLQWVDEATGLDCLIVRQHWGVLCGYVGLPPGHPLHGASDHDVDVDVHGGLTFADRCMEGLPEGQGVCHVPEPGRPADVWWLGFDCGHGWDVMPGMDAQNRELGIPPMPTFPGGPPVTYKTIGFVRAEVTRLAEQLAVTAASSA